MNTGAGLAIAYHLEGRAEDVNIALQSGIYQYVFRLFELFQLYLLYSADDPGRYEKTLNRAFALADLFNIKNICPFMMIGLYYTAARKSLNQGDIEQVIIMLEHFSGLISEKPDQLKPGGDDFFNAIDNWLSDAELGAEVIQNEKTYKQRMLDAILNDTELLSVSQDPGIRSIIKKMTTLKERLNEKNTKNNS